MILAPSASSHADDLRPIPLSSTITGVQPMTGITLWRTNSAVKTVPVQLEFNYVGFDDVVNEKGRYDWSSLETILDEVASRKHQVVLRWHDTYVGKPTRVPAWIKGLPDYKETTANSEGKPTGFPDWSHPEYQKFVLEFIDHFSGKYDRDPRIAFVQVGFGLWAEYHIYEGPMELGKTFPSHAFQEQFARRMQQRFQQTPWMISVDAAGKQAPYAGNKELLAIPFGVFDDSFNHAKHARWNEPNWNTFGRDRWKLSPAGGEFSFFEKKDQVEALSPTGPHGRPFDKQAAEYHMTFIIGDAQPRHQPVSRIVEASQACGYRFEITRFESGPGKSIVTVRNNGVAPIYHDAFPAVDGIRAKESLKHLLPGQSVTAEIPTGGRSPILTIESDRLVPGQKIEFEASLKEAR